MRRAFPIVCLTASTLVLSGCSPSEKKAEVPAVAGPPTTGRLGMRQDVTLEPGPEGWWIVSVSGASPGPGPNPDNVYGQSGRIDLNGDGVTEIVQVRLSGPASTSVTVFTGEGSVAVYGADGVALLASRTRSHRGWPLLATWNRDAEQIDGNTPKIDNVQQWSGLDYAPVTS